MSPTGEYWERSQRFTGKCRQGARLFLQSSELRLPHPSPASECVLPSLGSWGGGDTHSLRERGWGVPIPTRWQTLWYSRFLPIRTLCSPAWGRDTIHRQYAYMCEIANFLRTLFVTKSQSWWRAALKMSLRKNFSKNFFLPVSDLDRDPGFGSGFKSGIRIRNRIRNRIQIRNRIRN